MWMGAVGTRQQQTRSGGSSASRRPWLVCPTWPLTSQAVCMLHGSVGLAARLTIRFGNAAHAQVLAIGILAQPLIVSDTHGMFGVIFDQLGDPLRASVAMDPFPDCCDGEAGCLPPPLPLPFRVAPLPFPADPAAAEDFADGLGCKSDSRSKRTSIIQSPTP